MNQQSIINHPTGTITINEVGEGRRRITVLPNNPDIFVPLQSTITRYPNRLIELIADIKGVAWVCNEIEREESPYQVRGNLKYGLLSFVPPEAFAGKTILDFGCGAGASTVILGQMFPQARIVGADFLDSYMETCRERAQFYNMNNVSFESIPQAGGLPKLAEPYDFIVLSAVYEHLLPVERRSVFPTLYGRYLKPGGVMFINELPYRYFPIERHTTGGLPFINYLPDWLAFWIAQHFSKAAVDATWEGFLRNGIRGGSVSEMKKILKKAGYPAPEVLRPSHLELQDDIALWAAMTTERHDTPGIRKAVPWIKLFKQLTGISMIHMLTLALRKPL